MDKKTFISELRQALSVLQEDELEDIVSEYEQHIDMKLKNGLTEEEAIADFGSLNELAADILEGTGKEADPAALAGAPGASLMVTPRDIDQRVEDMAKVIGYGVSLALQPELDLEGLELLVE